MTKKKTMKEKAFRKWEHLENRRCIICKKPFVAKIYWNYSGENILQDYWVISSVYCSTKCSKEGYKRFMKAD